MKEQPNYYAIITADVRYDERLKPNEKLLYGEITALANKDGYCWASNTYFSKLYKVHKKTVSNWISNLEKNGYITISMKRNKETNEVEKRMIYTSKQVIDARSGKNGYPIHEKMDTLSTKSWSSNNTSINNTSLNKDIVLQDKTRYPYKEVIDYLNAELGTNYKHTTNKNKELIKARCNEGFKLEDFKKVIDIKKSEWKNDSRMSKYLRPATLFGNKFESYLNQNTNINNEVIEDEEYFRKIRMGEL